MHNPFGIEVRDLSEVFTAQARGASQGGTCVMVGDDQQWIKDATEMAVAKFGCKPFSKTLFHIPTGGSHDQETFNHEEFETKCAGEPSHTTNLFRCPSLFR
jgi:hypothetical protein